MKLISLQLVDIYILNINYSLLFASRAIELIKKVFLN